ncbi:MAG TPA: helix-turn-helix domain-containing protein [Blastocatellia bacterium]|nr:helix-turn-helix domain-containing protein [Blastocatellia bacterium]
MELNSESKKSKKAPRTSWWAAVWRGLVFDKEAKHYRRIRTALWLYLYLLLHANWETGRLFRKYSTIAADMGISERTIRNWMMQLKSNRYVDIETTGRSVVIHIRKYKAWGSTQADDKSGNSTARL